MPPHTKTGLAGEGHFLVLTDISQRETMNPNDWIHRFGLGKSAACQTVDEVIN